MNKFIIGTFLILGFGFYELSGGAEFQPEQREITELAAVKDAPVVVPFNAPKVSRAATIEIPVAEAVIVEASLEEPAEAPVIAETPLDLRVVSGNRVNMRMGPGTNYGVLDKLTRGAQAEVLEVTGDGWSRIRVIETGQIGWMSSRLLSAI
ncbi:MAG: SH3 domain-containing protein [Yoonia sp.]|nr:SH3 domain-containing protein [Yoonia sp.]